VFSIEPDAQNWVVQHGTATVSVHPNREEAERAVEWLDKHSVVGAGQAVLFGALTPRESVVLERLSHRGSYAEIARELFVSTNTIKTHVQSIYAKLGVSDRGSAVAAATVLGLLDDTNGVRTNGESGDNATGRASVTAEAARRYLVAFAYVLSAHDLTRYASLLRPDARLVTPLRTCEGSDAIIESNQQVIDAIPDLSIEARHVTVDPAGNRAIFECLHSGTLARDFSTPYGVIPANGQRFQIASVHVVTFDRSGLVSEVHRYWDLYELLRANGLAGL
jgi:DNA-binding CsgD family transcriptional regulator/predicted ester cyclase